MLLVAQPTGHDLQAIAPIPYLKAALDRRVLIRQRDASVRDELDEDVHVVEECDDVVFVGVVPQILERLSRGLLRGDLVERFRRRYKISPGRLRPLLFRGEQDPPTSGGGHDGQHYHGKHERSS